jgi:Zn-dependent membrane protease YugP
LSSENPEQEHLSNSDSEDGNHPSKRADKNLPAEPEVNGEPDVVSDWDNIIATTEEEIEEALAEAEKNAAPREKIANFDVSWRGDLRDNDPDGVNELVLLAFVVASGLLLIAGFWGSVVFSDRPLAQEIRAWGSVFWPIVLLVLLQTQLIGFAGRVLKLLQRKLDHKYPDDMDVHSGHWLEKRLRELGLAHDVEVSGAAEEFFRVVDAYDPSREIVFLSDVTYHKNDPTFWAIAAHELGHVLVHRPRKAWSFINMKSRFLFRQAMAVLPFWLLANTLYGSELGNSMILGLLVVGLVTGVCVVLDEAWASIHALRLLRDDDRIHMATSRDIALLLGSALSTYAAPLFVFAMYLIIWGPMSELLLNANFEVAQPLEGTQQAVVAGASLILLGFVGRDLWRLVRAHDLKIDLEPSFASLLIELVRVVLILAAQVLFFGFVWNLGESDGFLIAALLAATRFGVSIMLLSVPFHLVVGFLLSQIAKHLIGTVPDVPTGHKGVEEKTMKRNKLLDSDSWTIWTRGAASWTWFADLPLIIWWWTSL